MNSKKFKFEMLRESYTKPIVIGVVVFVIIMSAIILKTTRAKYQLKQSVPLVKGTINYTLIDFEILEMYIDGEVVEEIPEDGNYELDNSQSYCTLNGEKLDVVIEYDSNSHALSVTPMENKGTKCYLYFESTTTKKVETVLGILRVNLDNPDFSKTSCSDGCEEATVGIYEAEDDDGTSYYYRGDVENNYMYFAGYYWRIIRVNGDGTVRLIYAGTIPVANGTDDTTNYYQRTNYTTFSINSSSHNDNAYVGYMYGTPGSSTYAATHTNTNSSGVKNELDAWYVSDLANYAEFIDTNAGFCGDRTSDTSLTGTPTNGTSGGYGTISTFYGAMLRLYNGASSSNASPSFQCTQTNDLYTLKSATKGNKALTYPIGLITADEVVYAGGSVGLENRSYYLYTGFGYWTMSPSWVNYSGSALEFGVTSSGACGSLDVYIDWEVRPVINLKADITFSGSGTASDPYVIV